MRIETVDPDDDEAFAAWCAVLDEVEQDLRPGETSATPTGRRASVRGGERANAAERVVPLLAREGERAVGAALVELPLKDNLHYAELAVSVRRQARRRGAGAALAAEAERVGREHGRTTVAGGVDEPPGAGSAGRAFAQSRGYAEVLVEQRRDLDLPLDPERVSSLTELCAAYASGFSVRTWHGPCPEELVDDLAVLLQRMSTDTPLGGFDVHEEAWDRARIRQHEALLEEQRRTLYAAGAVHEGTGRLVAFTRVGVEDELPERAHQWETLVLREHRGARLGTVVKLACLEQVAAHSPATRLVTTWNAAVNAPMIRVNDALGARTNGGMSFWQRVEARDASPPSGDPRAS